MAGDPNNVIVGAGTLCLDNFDLGFTQGGITIRRDQEITSIMADQSQVPVRKFRQNETFVVATSLQEATLQNLLIVFGYPDDSLSANCLTLGYQNSCFLKEHKLVVKGPGPGCGCRTFVFNRVVAVQGSTEYVLSRESNTALAVEFEALVDDNGEIGVVCDGCTFYNSQVCN